MHQDTDLRHKMQLVSELRSTAKHARDVARAVERIGAVELTDWPDKYRAMAAKLAEAALLIAADMPLVVTP